MDDIQARNSAAELLVADARRFTSQGGLLLRHVLTQFFALVYDLPASERHHHSWRFGLVDHCLEVALDTLFRISIAARRSDSVAQLAAPTLAVALFHDLGKLFDVIVEDPTSGQRWDPLVESLSSFLNRPEMNASNSVRTSWRSGRGFMGHPDQEHLLRMMTPEEWTSPVMAISIQYETRFRRYPVRAQPPLDYLANAIARADGQSAWHGHPKHPLRGQYLRQLLSSAEAA
jgi:hypothetical protein